MKLCERNQWNGTSITCVELLFSKTARHEQKNGGAGRRVGLLVIFFYYRLRFSILQTSCPLLLQEVLVTQSLRRSTTMSCTTADALDRRLVAMVKQVTVSIPLFSYPPILTHSSFPYLCLPCQIEKNYIHLSKQERLRVERWVEKLVSSVCPLVAWKRDRNAYISLLHRMVKSKQLSTPFHSIPPDGILPRFPTYIIHHNENIHTVSAGDTRHERFWSSIHHHLSSQPTSSSSATPQKKIPTYHDKSEQENRRVIILEQLLRDERLKHCWQLNQLDAIHKSELSSLWGNWQSNNSSQHSSPSGYTFPSSSSFVNLPIDMRERAVMHGMNDGLPSYRNDGPGMRNAYDHHESNSTTSFQPLSSPATAPSSSSSSSSRGSRTNITTESSPLAAAKAAALLAATGIEEALAAIRALEVEESYRVSMDQPTSAYPSHYSSSKDGNTPKEVKRSSHVSFSPVVIRMGGQESVDSSVDGWYPQSPQRNDNVTLFSSPVHQEIRSTTSDAAAATTTTVTATTVTTTVPQDTSNGIVEASMSDATFLNYIEQFQSDLQQLHATPINVATPL